MITKRFVLWGVILACFISNAGFTFPLSGAVQKDSYVQGKSKKVIDSVTGLPIDGAVVSIPSKGIAVMSDGNGNFELDADINKPVIMSVRKQGYKPFSLTIDKNGLENAFTLSISKQKVNEIVIDADLRHLGDNNFSFNSANAGEFKTDASGPSFSKEFFVKSVAANQRTSIVIGSIIGLDTEIARRLKQNNIMYARSSPAEVFVNAQKVGELKINGDNQEIDFSPRLLNPNSYNRVTVKTGQNLNQKSYVDYDDIEIMNLFLEIK